MKLSIIRGCNAQAALEVFARYFEVEPHILNASEKSQFRLNPELMEQDIDQNTIGVFFIMYESYSVPSQRTSVLPGESPQSHHVLRRYEDEDIQEQNEANALQ